MWPDTIAGTGHANYLLTPIMIYELLDEPHVFIH